jgi:DNA-binding MarR family transcriptional regulator
MEPINRTLTAQLENIYDSFRRLEARSLTALRHKLSIGEWHIIDRVGPGPGRRMGDLAAASGVTLASMTVAVDKLEKKGFLRRARAPEDRRGVVVSLTRRGGAAYRVHQTFHGRMLAAMLEGLDEAQVRALTEVFAKLQRFVDGN